jgi:hypothetical protein
MRQPELPVDSTSVSMSTPMALVTDSEQAGKISQQACLPSPSSPPDDCKPNLATLAIAPGNESPKLPTASLDVQPPPPAKRGRPRRRRSTEKETLRSPPPSPAAHRKPHHVVERKYRQNMNMQMERLRAVIPLQQPSDNRGAYTAHRRVPSKTSVLQRSVEEIETLRLENERAGAAVLRLENEVKALREDRDYWKKRAETLWQAGRPSG